MTRSSVKNFQTFQKKNGNYIAMGVSTNESTVKLLLVLSIVYVNAKPFSHAKCTK